MVYLRRHFTSELRALETMTPSTPGLRPHLLAPDNFTPASRTPWGGRRIMSVYKAALGLSPALADQPVGESWELSFGPELPSRTADGVLLGDLVATDLHAYLGLEAARGGSALLVKWLDADDHLSVQIHPDVQADTLAADETGKPEAWYIVAAQPGAGIYLGLQAGVGLAQMQHALAHGADVSQLLRFQPVAPGDFYLLPPGLPHAVGRGVTLIEPQYVLPGKKAVTLRYWDWNRRYDAHGRLHPSGRSRELHVERALAATAWQCVGDPAWLAEQRTALAELDLAARASCSSLCGPEGGATVRSPYLRAARLAGHGTVDLPDWGTLRGLTVVDGTATLHGEFGTLRVPRGMTVVVAAALGLVACQLEHAHAVVSSVAA
jgi:mannose-6-phosphate isomerase